MSVDNFKPTIWSRELLYTLKKSHVAGNIINRNYQGDITGEGDTVKIQTPNSIDVGNYTGADITFQGLTSATQSLIIDKAKYFAFLADDVDQAQANIPLVQSYMQESSYSLADVLDQFVLNFYTDADASNVIPPETLTSSTIYDKMVEAGRLLDNNDVPSMGRWIVLSPDEKALLSTSDDFTSASMLGDDTKRTGFTGEIAGFEVYMSNNVQEATETVDTVSENVRHLMFGSTSAITVADQIVKTEAGRREKAFGDYVKGLHVYGGKVVRPTALGDLKAIQ